MPNIKPALKSGFTLIQLSIILTVASLVFVATLPGTQTSLKEGASSVTKMNNILNTMRGYMAANGVLPCPADPTQAIGASNYGVAAANPGTGSPGNCIGGSPAAAYADTSKNIAIGMVPVKTLGLSYADAVDGYGRDITYAVDTNATGNASGAACWSSSSLTGAITVNDNGITANTVAVLVSHGQDGYGAWLPLSGTSGTASRLDNGSTDTAQADNAQVAHGGGLTANGANQFQNFWRKSATSTFDDLVVYKSNIYTLNTLPTSAQAYPTMTTYPANNNYTTGNTWTFTLTYTTTVTVTGTPRLDLSALSGGSIGTGNVAYATYQSGSGTTVLTFSYTVQAADSAPNGISLNGWIDLNGGTLSGGSTCFTAPGLSGVTISSAPIIIYLTTGTTTWTVPANWNSSNNTIEALGSGGKGGSSAFSAGGGGGGGGYAKISNFSSTSGTVINVTIGSGGGTTNTQFNNSSTLVAAYGANASGSTAGVGGTANVGTVTHNGGNGGAGGGSGGAGGGGGSACPNGNGAGGGTGNASGGGGGGSTAVRGSLDPIHETGRSNLIWQRLYEKRSGET